MNEKKMTEKTVELTETAVTTLIEKKAMPTVETIVRTVVLLFTFVNLSLAFFGKKLPFTEDAIYQWATVGATLAVMIWTWWENNSFTKGAITADKIIDVINGKDK